MDKHIPIIDCFQSFESVIQSISLQSSPIIALTCKCEISSNNRIQKQAQLFEKYQVDALTASFWIKSHNYQIFLPRDLAPLVAEFLNRPHWLMPNWLWQRESLLTLLQSWQPLDERTWFYELFLKAALNCKLAAIPEVCSGFSHPFSLAPSFQQRLLERYFNKPQPQVMEFLWATLSRYPTGNAVIYQQWQSLLNLHNPEPYLFVSEKPPDQVQPPNWVDPFRQKLLQCVHEPTSKRFNTLGLLHRDNLLIKHLCSLASLNLQPNQPTVFAESSVFWQNYCGNWPTLLPLTPQCPVSVLITTFDRPRILANAITSVLKQTYQDFEIVVINDGGDPTAALTIEEFNDPRLRYFHIPNSGQAAAFNYGIQQAVGQYFAFLDDDDVFHPQHLEISLRALTQPGVELVYGQSQQVQGYYQADGQFIAVGYLSRIGEFYCQRRALSHCIFGNPANTVVQRQLLQRTGLFNEALPWGREWDLWLRCCEFTHPYFSHHISGEYRRSSENMTNEWYRGMFYEVQLLGLFYRTARGSLTLYTAALHSLDKSNQQYWLDVFLKYPSALNATALAQAWQQLHAANTSPSQEVLRKLLTDNPLATLKLVQQRIISPQQIVKLAGHRFLQALWASLPELRDRFQRHELEVEQ